MQYKKLKAPFGWIGGKSQLSKDIVSLMPDHKIYIEVFGGALSVFYAKKPSKLEIVNDINSDLINLHRVIRNYPQTLSLYLDQLLISREIFSDIKSKKLKPKNIYKNFMTWSKRLKRVTIENLSFQKLIPLYDKQDSFFYCDPPYFGTESYYKNTGVFKKDKHILLYKTLSNIKGMFLISYNDCVFIRELYKDFNIISSKEIKYTLCGSKKPKKTKEIFIYNYDFDIIRKWKILER